MELIDKSAVVAEIKSLRRTTFTNFDEGVNATVQTLLETLDTLEVKEVKEETVSETLEEAAFDYAEACKYDGGEKLLCVEHFKAGAEWMAKQGVSFEDKTMLIKATEWLSANLHRYDEHIGLSAKEFVERFKKAMGKPAAALLWHPADGDYLPEIEREVVALCQPYLLEGDEYSVTFAHRPNPNGWDVNIVTTGKVKHYTPKTYDKGGWNIPDVKFWLDCEFPKMEE